MLEIMPTTKKPAKIKPTTMRLNPALKVALEKAATADKRTVTSLTEIILEAWLKERGFMK